MSEPRIMLTSGDVVAMLKAAEDRAIQAATPVIESFYNERERGQIQDTESALSLLALAHLIRWRVEALLPALVDQPSVLITVLDRYVQRGIANADQALARGQEAL